MRKRKKSRQSGESERSIGGATSQTPSSSQRLSHQSRKEGMDARVNRGAQCRERCARSSFSRVNKPLPDLSRRYITAAVSRAFPGSSVVKETPCNAGNPGSVPGLGKIPLEKGQATHSSILGLPWGHKW